jgi:hypothetical protein
MALQQPLKDALNTASREEIGEVFFQSEYSRSNDTDNFEPFFKYYEEEIKLLKIGADPSCDEDTRRYRNSREHFEK